MVVVLLLVGIWAVVLVPPALQASAERRQAFAVSFGSAVAGDTTPSPAARSDPVRRRRRILGGLLTAIAATGFGGLLPGFRLLLVVDLFLVDSFLGYVAVLAHQAGRRRREAAPGPAAGHVGAVPGRPAGRRAGSRVTILGDLTPMAPAG